MLRRLRAALSTQEGKLKAVIVVSGAAILLIILTVGALGLTSTPAFCNSCHEMSPEYYTWQGSAHNQIACVKCHIKPGAANFVEHKIESLSQVYYHFTGSYITPIEIKEPIDNSVCMQCHDMQKRVTTPSGDIKFPHTKHLAENVQCVQCHAGVVHGSIEEKGLTAIPDYNAWNAPVGKAYTSSPVSKYFTRITMQDCIDCHKERNAPQTCETCHSKLVKPDSHKAANWLSGGHGAAAASDFKACDQCHAVSSKYNGDLPVGIKLAEYARTNTFCNGCHAKKPDGHDAMWRKTHTTPAKANRTLCLVCHDEAGPNPTGGAPTTLVCQKCHAQRHNSYNPALHPIKVPPSGYSAICATCHNPAACEKCHSRAAQ